MFHNMMNCPDMHKQEEPSIHLQNCKNPDVIEILCEIPAFKRIKLDFLLPTDSRDSEDSEKENIPPLHNDISSDPVGFYYEKNPFLLNPVLSVLFSHMDVPTLKSARQVCRLWNHQVMPVFLKKTEAVMIFEEICHASCLHRLVNSEICQDFLDMMDEVLETDSEIPFDSLRINFMDMRKPCSKKMGKLFRKYGYLLSSLQIMFCNSDNDDEENDYNLDSFFVDDDLKLILLHWCVNLKTLRLINLPFIIAESDENLFLSKERTERKNYIPGGPVSSITTLQLCDERNYFPLSKMMVYHLLKVSPHVTTIEIDVEDEDAFEAFMDGLLMARKEGFLKNLHSLKFGDKFGCIFYENHIGTLIAMKLRELKRLEILNMGQDMRVHSLSELLGHCSDTLQVFRLQTTGVTDLSQMPTSTLNFQRKMKNLRTLEIKCDKIQLRENLNIIENFPKLNKCILDTDCDCEFQFTGKFWNSITLNCYESAYFQPIKIDTRHLLLQYNAHCVRISERIKNWFPNVKSIYASKGADRFGLVDLFKTMKETTVEELFVDVSCQMSHGRLCCHNESLEEEERDLTNNIIADNPKNFYFTSNGHTNSMDFTNLRKLKIVTQGCRNINIGTLRQLGILHMLENAKELADFTIEYTFQNSSKEVVIFDFGELFKSEQ